MDRILECRIDVSGIDAESVRERFRKALCLCRTKFGRAVIAREETLVAPHRDAILAPVTTQRPSRQLLARIPFSLSVVEKPARREALIEPPQQLLAEPAFVLAERRDVPLGALHVIDRYESWLAAHRETDIARADVAIDLEAERFDTVPLLVRIRQGHAWIFMNPRDAHFVMKLDLARADQTRNWRG